MQPKKLSEFSDQELSNLVRSVQGLLARAVTDAEDDLHDKYGSLTANQIMFMALTDFYADGLMFYVRPEDRSACLQQFLTYIMQKSAMENVAGTA